MACVLRIAANVCMGVGLAFGLPLVIAWGLLHAYADKLQSHRGKPS